MAKLIFLHLPKTAGSSLKWALFERFPSHTYVKKNALVEDHLAYDLVAGHFSMSSLRALAVPALPPVITVLREPFERFISEVRMARRNPHPGRQQHWSCALRALPLEELVHTLPGRRALFQQSIALGSRAEVTDDFDPRAMADRAQETLRRDVSVFGTTEHYVATVRLFAHELGLPDLIEQRRNVAPKLGFEAITRELTPELREQIQSILLPERELYEVAARSFADRCLRVLGKYPEALGEPDPPGPPKSSPVIAGKGLLARMLARS